MQQCHLGEHRNWTRTHLVFLVRCPPHIWRWPSWLVEQEWQETPGKFDPSEVLLVPLWWNGSPPPPAKLEMNKKPEETGLVLPCRTKEEWIWIQHIRMNQSFYHIEVEKVNDNHQKITKNNFIVFFKTIIKATVGTNLSLTLYLKQEETSQKKKIC